MEKLAEKPLNPACLVFAAWPLGVGRAPPRNSRKRAADRRGRAPRSRLPVLRLPGRREASSRHQAADFWIRPFSAKRAASSRSAVVKWEPRSCNWATKRTRNMPRFPIGKPAAAAQIARSCESDKASMPPWSCWGDGCQLIRSGCDGPGREGVDKGVAEPQRQKSKQYQ